jgi:hypothetical protein
MMIRAVVSTFVALSVLKAVDGYERKKLYADSLCFPGDAGVVPDETDPVVNPITGIGWYFEKTVANSDKINWYYFANAGGSPLNPGAAITFANVESVWSVVDFYSPPTAEAPYFTLYTVKTGGSSFYDHRIQYLLPNDVALTGRVFLWAGDSGDPGVHPEITARLQLTNFQLAYQGATPALPPNDVVPPGSVISLISLQTATNEVPPISFSVEGLGYTTGIGVNGDFQLVFGNCDSRTRTGKGGGGTGRTKRSKGPTLAPTKSPTN